MDATATASDPGKQSRVAAHIPVVAAFDGYRAYAILGLVVVHLLGISGVVVALGDNWLAHLIMGTLANFPDILFIISGFVVFLPTVARHGEFGNVASYALRRAARLVPAYWLALAAIMVLTVLVPIHPNFPFPALPNIGIHAAFLQMSAVRMFHAFGPIGFGRDDAVWTLSLEVTFYVILPFIAAWYFRRPILGLVIAAAITAIWQEGLVHAATTQTLVGYPSERLVALRMGRQFPVYAFSFAAGMTGAWAYVRLRELYPPAQLASKVGLPQLISLVALGFFCYVRGWGDVGEGLFDRNAPIIVLGFTASLTALMVTTALGQMRWQRPFAHPFARWLGDISYGMFLIHMLIINYAIRLFVHPTALQGPFGVHGDGSLATFVGLAAIVLPLTVLYGYLSARVLEQPIRRWAQRFGRRRQAVATQAEAAKASAG
jgi:peptidoglycan/LPS O-acetylase OafA/YrhL